MPHRFRATSMIALALTFAVVAAACNKNAGSSASSATNSSPLPGAGKVVCEVSDSGGFNDKSFNQTADAGVRDAATQLGITRIALESNTASDYVPNLQACLQKNPNLVVTVGFNLAKATKDAAKKNPNTEFAIVDNPSEASNILGLNFSTDQAAFLAGYLAAGMTKTGKVGTFGGINIPPVTIYMNGFAAGIDKYNQDNNKNIQLLGWDPAKQDGTFSGDFTNEQKGQTIAQQFISQGADIIFPVAGPVGLGAAAAAKQAGSVNVIWVDVDGCVSAPEYCSLFITSVEKKMDIAVFQATKDMVNGSFKGGDYQGTLENGGVGLAPFHDFASQVPQALQNKLKELQTGIIDGSISVDPKSYS